jgi:hypothetical protein
MGIKGSVAKSGKKLWDLAEDLMSGEEAGGGDFSAPKWTVGEVQDQVVAINAALRQKREDLLEQALERFGGLAPFEMYQAKSGSIHPLDASAKMREAFGFKRLMDAALAAHEREARESGAGHGVDLGRFLRTGLPIAGDKWDDGRDNDRDASPSAPVGHGAG